MVFDPTPGLALTYLDIILAVIAIVGAVLEAKKRYIRKYLDMVKETYDKVDEIHSKQKQAEDERKAMTTAIIDMAYAQDKEEVEIHAEKIHEDLSDEDFNKYTGDD